MYGTCSAALCVAGLVLGGVAAVALAHLPGPRACTENEMQAAAAQPIANPFLLARGLQKGMRLLLGAYINVFQLGKRCGQRRLTQPQGPRSLLNPVVCHCPLQTYLICPTEDEASLDLLSSGSSRTSYGKQVQGE